MSAIQLLDSVKKIAAPTTRTFTDFVLNAQNLTALTTICLRLTYRWATNTTRSSESSLQRNFGKKLKIDQGESAQRLLLLRREKTMTQNLTLRVS
jgi:hypothetical protein